MVSIEQKLLRGGAVAARRAHNPKVAGSNPAPATIILFPWWLKRGGPTRTLSEHGS